MNKRERLKIAMRQIRKEDNEFKAKKKKTEAGIKRIEHNNKSYLVQEYYPFEGHYTIAEVGTKRHMTVGPDFTFRNPDNKFGFIDSALLYKIKDKATQQDIQREMAFNCPNVKMQ